MKIDESHIFSLLSVITGGMMTYFSTYFAEKRKNKQQLQKDNLEKIFIPYCTSIETAIEEIDKIGVVSCDDKNFEIFMNYIKAPLEFLNAEKRIFLNKSMRKDLQNYKQNIDNFFKKLDLEYSYFMHKYTDYIISKLNPFPYVYHEYIDISLKNTNEIKMFILQKKYHSLLNNIYSVDFISHDHEYYYSSTLNETVRNIWEDSMCRNDLDPEEDSEIYIACMLLDFIYENIKTTKELELLHTIIDTTACNKNLLDLKNKLETIHTVVINEIDKIVN